MTLSDLLLGLGKENDVITDYKDIKPGMVFNAVTESDWIVLRMAIEGELCHDITKIGSYAKVHHQRGHLWWCKDQRASDYAAMLVCFHDLGGDPEAPMRYNMRMPKTE